MRTIFMSWWSRFQDTKANKTHMMDIEKIENDEQSKKFFILKTMPMTPENQ